MTQRRCALIADRQQFGPGAKRFVAPKLLRVTSSCVAKWRSEENDYSEGALIWEWDEIMSIPPNIPVGGLVHLNMPQMNSGSCPHCCPANPTSNASSANQPSTSSADPQQPSTSSGDPQQPATGTDTDMDISDDGDDDDDDDSVTREAHIIHLKGSTLETRYQNALKEVREDMLGHKKDVPIKLDFERDNPADWNAIKIEAHVKDVWKIIGYVPVQKIPKVTSAMRKNEIVSVKLACVPKFQFHPVKHGFGASVVVVKKGKWPADDRRNVYNSDLSHI